MHLHPFSTQKNADKKKKKDFKSPHHTSLKKSLKDESVKTSPRSGSWQKQPVAKSAGKLSRILWESTATAERQHALTIAI